MIRPIMIIILLLSISVSASNKFEEDCKNGKMQSCIELGMLYYNGEGVDKDVRKSKKLFTKACKGRVSRACYYLGYVFLRGGEGIDKNNKKAMLAFGRACNIGSERSCVQYHKLKNKGY